MLPIWRDESFRTPLSITLRVMIERGDSGGRLRLHPWSGGPCCVRGSRRRIVGSRVLGGGNTRRCWAVHFTLPSPPHTLDRKVNCQCRCRGKWRRWDGIAASGRRLSRERRRFLSLPACTTPPPPADPLTDDRHLDRSGTFDPRKSAHPPPSGPCFS